MNVILISEHEMASDSIVLTDYRAKHITKILKSDVGDTLKIGTIGGRLGTAEVIFLHRKYPFRVELRGSCDIEPPEKNPVDFIIALPRPIMLRRILSQITALGVGTLHIVNAKRVEKSFWEASLITQQEYHKFLLDGLEQCVDTIVPKVVFHRRFKPFIEDSICQIGDQYDTLLYAHPLSRNTISPSIISGSGKVLVAVGPEGGWVDYETAKLREYGFTGFSIGPRILKVDTAIVNIHGRIIAEIEGNQRG